MWFHIFFPQHECKGYTAAVYCTFNCAILCFITDLDFPGVVQHDESKKKTSGEADQALQDIRIHRILKEKM